MRRALGFAARGFGYLVFGAVALGVLVAVLGGLAAVIATHVIVAV